jgi:hypothetical protein
MPTLEIFDPPLCCPTGVCGPAVDPALVRFGADLDWLRGQGIAVQRFNLAQQPEVFAGRPEVKATMAQTGTSCLPLVLVDGRIVSRGTYPTRADLASWAGVAPVVSLPLGSACCGGGTSSCC